MLDGSCSTHAARGGLPMWKRTVALLLGLAVCLLTAWLVSCKSGGATDPTYTGGGGTGGTTPELNGNLAAGGGTYSHTFNTAGTFNYLCTFHPTCPGLKGTIVVVAAGTPSQNRVLAITQGGGAGARYPSCSGLSLVRDTVRVGDAITWTNSSSLGHTVVSQ